MKTTNQKVLNACMALTTMGKKVTGKVAFSLFQVKRKLQVIVDFEAEEEHKLVDKFGGILTERGVVIIDDPKKRAEFNKENAELGKMEVEIDLEPVTVSLDKVPDVNLQEIEALDGFVKFE